VPAADTASPAATPALPVAGFARPVRFPSTSAFALLVVALLGAIVAWVNWGGSRPRAQREEAYVVFRQADRLFADRRSATDNAGARKLFRQALALDGDHVPSLIGYAATELDDVLNAWSARTQHPDQLARAERALARAIALDPRNAYGHRFQGRLFRLQGKAPEAVLALERALALNPYIAPAHAELGRAKIEVGRAAETVGHVETAIRLSPHDRWIYGWSFWAGLGALHVGDDTAAVAWFEKGLQAKPNFTLPLPWLAMAHALLGREEEGRVLIKTYLRESPDYTVAAWTKIYSSSNPIVASQRERIIAGLRRLQVPEGDVQTGSVRLQ
jgi:tetratricopeptide (TPR) repeat protein